MITGTAAKALWKYISDISVDVKMTLIDIGYDCLYQLHCV